MDQFHNLFYPEPVGDIIKQFQLAATCSLQGPAPFQWIHPSKFSFGDYFPYQKAAETYLNELKRKQELKPLPPRWYEQTTSSPHPSASSSTTSGNTYLSETSLEGQVIACFLVGGERRLCLPQILNTLLKPFDIEQVHQVCQQLNIYFSRCDDRQLHSLKGSGILPEAAQSCGLITKTDAERLCHQLLHRKPEKAVDLTPSSNSFYVYHECFGKCKGLFIPERYTHASAKCITCSDCDGLFTTQTFVCHSHKPLENRTCHWGFDSQNWRSYLLLAKHQSHLEALEKSLEEIKARFEATSQRKRKQVGT